MACSFCLHPSYSHLQTFPVTVAENNMVLSMLSIIYSYSRSVFSRSWEPAWAPSCVSHSQLLVLTLLFRSLRISTSTYCSSTPTSHLTKPLGLCASTGMSSIITPTTTFQNSFSTEGYRLAEEEYKMDLLLRSTRRTAPRLSTAPPKSGQRRRTK